MIIISDMTTTSSEQIKNWIDDLYRQNGIESNREAERFTGGAVSYSTFNALRMGQPVSESMVLRIAHLMGSDVVYALQQVGYDKLAEVVKTMIIQAASQERMPHQNKIFGSNNPFDQEISETLADPIEQIKYWINRIETERQNSPRFKGNFVAVDITTGKIFEGNYLPSEWKIATDAASLRDAVAHIMLALEEQTYGDTAFDLLLENYNEIPLEPSVMSEPSGEL